jgi:hypothetical protein
VKLHRHKHGLGQYGGGFSVSGLASAIQTMEGYYPPGTPGYPTGSLSYRNNNPGNLRPGSLAVGATGSNGGYAVFPNYQTGLNALVGLIQSPAYWNLTLTQFFAQYAPASDGNNPGSYAATVAANLGVDANTPLSQLATGGGAVAAVTDPSSDGGSGTDASGDAISTDPTDTTDTSEAGSLSPLALGLGIGAAALALWLVL